MIKDRDIYSTTAKTGRHANPVLDERRCWNCGFICNSKRDLKVPYGFRSGDGLSYDDTFNTSLITNGWGTTVWGKLPFGDTEKRNDVTVDAGCPLCGTLTWDEK